MKQGLKFTPTEEAEFKEMTRFHPASFGEWMGVKADSVANTIWMFFALILFSIISYVCFQAILDKMLFISNTYQLIALPILGLATGLSMIIILRFLFLLHLENREQFAMLKESHDDLKELVTQVHVKIGASEVDVTATMKTEEA